MHLVIHQFKKDLRRVRLPLAVWLAFVALQFVLAGWTVKPGDQVMQYLHTILGFVLPVINGLLVMVLVPLVFHQEPLVGTTAFWLTRPLPRRTMMAAKGLFLALLILLPLLAQTVMLAVNGVTPHDVALAALQILLSQLAWVLAVAALAALTAGFGRFAVVGIVSFIAWYLLGMAVTWLRLFKDPLSASAFSELTASRGAIGSGLMIAFGAAVVVHQYQTRRTRRSVALAVAGIALVFATQQFWPWNVLPQPPTAARGTVPDTTQMTFALGRNLWAGDSPDIRGGTPTKVVSNSLVVDHAPPELVITIRKIDATLKTAAGQPLRIESQQTQNFNNFPPPRAIEAALGDVTLLNPGMTHGPFLQLFRIDAATFNAHASEPLAFSAEVTVTASKCVVTGELPLAKGARLRKGSAGLVITDVLKQPLGVDVTLREKKVRLLFAAGDDPLETFGLRSPKVIYVLLNRKRREAVQAKQNLNFLSMMSRDILVSQPLNLSFGPDSQHGTQDDQVFPLPADWLADAVLVRLEIAPGIEVTKPLASDHLRMDGKSPQTAAAREPETTLESLEKITLPADPTREQVAAYIDAIVEASHHQRTFHDSDPQIEMLTRIGASNTDLLIEKARTSHNWYLLRAIVKLAGEEEKGRILGLLPENPDLIEVVTARHWEADAKDILVTGLAQDGFGMKRQWFKAVSSLKDPSTYGALRDYFIAHPDGYLYSLLQPLPGFDLAGALDGGWPKAASARPFRAFDLLPDAASAGKADALAMAGKILKGELHKENAFALQEARRVFAQATTAPGKTDEEFVAWYDANKDRLVYDPAAKKFTSSSTPVPSSAETSATP